MADGCGWLDCWQRSFAVLHGPLHAAQLSRAGDNGLCTSGPPRPQIERWPESDFEAKFATRVESNRMKVNPNALSPRHHPPTTIRIWPSSSRYSTLLLLETPELTVRILRCRLQESAFTQPSRTRAPFPSPLAQVSAPDLIPRRPPRLSSWPPGWRAHVLRHVASIPFYAVPYGVHANSIPPTGQPGCPRTKGQDQEGQIHDPFSVRRPNLFCLLLDYVCAVSDFDSIQEYCGQRRLGLPTAHVGYPTCPCSGATR